MSDYSDALKAAGCEVLAYQEFGSYQGEWLAKVRKDGEVFWLRDYFGSCSGCDALQADVGYGPWDDSDADEVAAYQAKLRAFGESLIEPQERLTFAGALAAASANLEWDSSAEEMVEWLKANENAETPVEGTPQ